MLLVFQLLAGTLLLGFTQAGDLPNYIGCFKDERTRALPYELDNPNSELTLEVCRELCSGYPYMGVQSENECYCGHAGYDRYGFSNECNQTCSGNRSQTCGGHWMNSVYKIAEYSYRYKGCYEGDNDGWFFKRRALSEDHNDYKQLTIEICMNFCSGYKYFGVQNGDKCYCGNSGYDKYGLSSNCTTECSGNSSQICGGKRQNSIYEIVLISSKISSNFTVATATTALTTIGANDSTIAEITGKSLTSTSGPEISSVELTTKNFTGTEMQLTSEKTTDANNNGKGGGKQKQVNVGVYAGSAAAGIVVCAVIITLIVIQCRRKNMPSKQEAQFEMCPSNETEPQPEEPSVTQPLTTDEMECSYVNVRSAEQPQGTSSGENGKLTCPKEIAEWSPSDSVMLATEGGDAQNVYSLAAAVDDDLVVVDNELYGT